MSDDIRLSHIAPALVRLTLLPSIASLAVVIGRLLLGLFEGALVSAALAAGLHYGFGLTSWTALLAYSMAALAGVLIGLVAGKPIWAKGARVEASLKAFVGSGLALLGMYAVRRWLVMPADLGPLSRGEMPLGEIPAVSIALVVTTIAMLYELDNTGSSDTETSQPSKKRLASSNPGAMADPSHAEPGEDEQAALKQRKR